MAVYITEAVSALGYTSLKPEQVYIIEHVLKQYHTYVYDCHDQYVSSHPFFLSFFSLKMLWILKNIECDLSLCSSETIDK